MEGRQRIGDGLGVSIRALPAEGDSAAAEAEPAIRMFQSAPSLRRATAARAEAGGGSGVSIRALPAEGDSARRAPPASRWRFNPRPPCGGRRCCGSRKNCRRWFQSAPSLRRATWVRVWVRMNRMFQSAPSLRRATCSVLASSSRCPFQSAPSLRRATPRSRGWGPRSGFNPRPPCGGRHVGFNVLLYFNCFNPRPPCGGRPKHAVATPAANQFQSAPSLRRATRRGLMGWASIPCFNPRPPCGGRRVRVSEPVVIPPVSIRALPAEGDGCLRRRLRRHRRFNPRPPCGGRLEDSDAAD